MVFFLFTGIVFFAIFGYGNRENHGASNQFMERENGWGQAVWASHFLHVMI